MPTKEQYINRLTTLPETRATFGRLFASILEAARLEDDESIHDEWYQAQLAYQKLCIDNLPDLPSITAKGIKILPTQQMMECYEAAREIWAVCQEGIRKLNKIAIL